MNTNYLIGLIVIIALAVGGYFILSKPQTPVPTTTETQTDTNTATTSDTSDTASTGGSAAVSVGVGVHVGAPITVNYTSSGFSPSTVTIQKGQTIVFVNKSGGPMWVASGEHPSHTDYDGTSRTTHCAPGYGGPAPFDECATGNSFTFTFNEVGSWPYHNHAGVEDTGTVVVTQ